MCRPYGLPVRERVEFNRRNSEGARPDKLGEPRRIGFDWRSKRDDTRIKLHEDGSLVTFPILLRTALAESQGHKPADFDRLIEIAAGGSEFETIDERLLLEAQPDFMPWLPRE